VNVRLSSVDALEKFNKNATVTQSLIDSIQRQDSPLVQIALIDALVRIRDHAAAEELKKLKTDTKANPSVRKRAQWGLQKLNYE
jgi:HEAT repeat protein